MTQFKRFLGVQAYDIMSDVHLIRIKSPLEKANDIFLGSFIHNNLDMKTGVVSIELTESLLTFSNNDRSRTISREFSADDNLHLYYNSLREIFNSGKATIKIDMDRYVGMGGEAIVFRSQKNRLLKVIPLTGDFDQPEREQDIRTLHFGDSCFQVNVTNIELLRSLPEYNAVKVRHENVIEYKAMVIQTVQNYRALVIELDVYKIRVRNP